MENYESIISKNISKYRKLAKLTQGELAEKLSFSDKSISKWERGESLPDIIVIIEMCKIFGITLNDIIKEDIVTPKIDNVQRNNQRLIATISAGIAWLIATVVFVSFLIFAPNVRKIWLSFVYAVPTTAIILLVFSCIWFSKKYKFLYITMLVWSIIVSLCLTFNIGWHLLYLGIPLQILLVFWWLLENNASKIFKNTKKKELNSFDTNIKNSQN